MRTALTLLEFMIGSALLIGLVAYAAQGFAMMTEFVL
jgi:hypothetical protein